MAASNWASVSLGCCLAAGAAAGRLAAVAACGGAPAASTDIASIAINNLMVLIIYTVVRIPRSSQDSVLK
jgi:hypothetical protein